MSLALTVLGSSASMQGPNDSCSGYLIRHGDTSILLDCRTGMTSTLQHVMQPGELSTIVISHFHPDHFMDLVPTRYGLRYGLAEPVRPRVYLPPGGVEYFQRVGFGLRESESYFSSVYDLAEYDPGSSAEDR